MFGYKLEIILAATLTLSTVLGVSIAKYAIRKFGRMASLDINHRKAVFHLAYGIILFFSITVLFLIGGVELEDFAIFVVSVLTVLGIGSFAKWSILSIITASVILFFVIPYGLGTGSGFWTRTLIGLESWRTSVRSICS